jgi:hypothetical protein
MWNAFLQEEQEVKSEYTASVATPILVENTALESHRILYHQLWTEKYHESLQFYLENRDKDPRYALHYAEGIFMTVLLISDRETRDRAIEQLDYAENVAKGYCQ